MRSIRHVLILMIVFLVAGLPAMGGNLMTDATSSSMAMSSDAGNASEPDMDCCDHLNNEMVAGKTSCSIDCHFLAPAVRSFCYSGVHAPEPVYANNIAAIATDLDLPPPRTV